MAKPGVCLNFVSQIDGNARGTRCLGSLPSETPSLTSRLPLCGLMLMRRCE